MEVGEVFKLGQVSWGVLMLWHGCGRFSPKASQVVSCKGSPSRLTQGKVVTAGIIVLNSLMFGNGICTFIARNSNVRSNHAEMNKVR
eukprot:1150059-Pelagomonas_calceolata.AAC.3